MAQAQHRQTALTEELTDTNKPDMKSASAEEVSSPVLFLKKSLYINSCMEQQLHFHTCFACEWIT